MEVKKKEKGFFKNLFEKLDKKLEKKSKEKGCDCNSGGKECSSK
jgi:hypothetical protein